MKIKQVQRCTIPLFDAHFHIIEPQFPLIASHGFTPSPFVFDEYQQLTKPYTFIGGVLVAGSFQNGFQDFLTNFLSEHGDCYVGITTLDDSISDKQIVDLDKKRIRGVRFNLYRNSESNFSKLVDFAMRVYDLVGWHVEIYVGNSRLGELAPFIKKMPKASIDHLGLTQEGLPYLYDLVEHGLNVKASGFMRVDFNVVGVLKNIHALNPNALMFGTDLPGTRASRQFSQDDLLLILNNFSESDVHKIIRTNALDFYRINSTTSASVV
jgi:predicted TIM-barrel fold metal-dependent hydrolase